MKQKEHDEVKGKKRLEVRRKKRKEQKDPGKTQEEPENGEMTPKSEMEQQKRRPKKKSQNR